ncbi:MAG: 5'-3' exonuclease [Planctomycetota bacterium]
MRSFHAGAPSQIHAVRGLLDTLRKLLRELRPDSIVFATEGGHGHRVAMHAGYKASRSETPDELRQQIDLAHRTLAALGWPLLRVEGYEADDVLAALARQLGQNAIIATTDKDLWQLAERCWIVDPYKMRRVDASVCQERFGVLPHQLGELLALAGDKSDDVPGVPGIGEKTAAKLFGDLDAILAASVLRQSNVSRSWSRIYEHRDDALLSRRLVTLVDELPVETPALSRSNIYPPAGWQDRLRDLGLGGNAKRLGDTFEALSLERPDDARARQRDAEPAGMGSREVDAVSSGQSTVCQLSERQSGGTRHTPRPDAGGSLPQLDTNENQRVTAADHSERVRSDRAGLLSDSSQTHGTPRDAYVRGRQWAEREPQLAAKARAGELTAVSVWGRHGRSEHAQAFFRGARGEALEVSVTPDSGRKSEKPQAAATLF